MPSRPIATSKALPVHRFSYGADPNQFVDVRIPNTPGPHPIVFFIHGGYWRAKYDLTTSADLCEALRQAGIATWNIEYRRVGQPGGGWPGTFEDVCAAFRMLSEKAKPQSLDVGRLCVAGHSAGGQLALCLAAREKSINRAVSLAGVLDLRRAWELHLSNDAVFEFLGGAPDQLPEHYLDASPAQQRITAVQRLVHGTADDSVPYELSRSYAETKKSSGEQVELLTLADVDHFEIIDPRSEAWAVIVQLFRQVI